MDDELIVPFKTLPRCSVYVFREPRSRFATCHMAGRETRSRLPAKHGCWMSSFRIHSRARLLVRQVSGNHVEEVVEGASTGER